MNRSIRLKVVLAGISSLLLVSKLFGELATPTYQVTHVAGMNEWSLVFPAEKGKEAYVDYRLALDIIDIDCDGQPLMPVSKEGMPHFNYETFPAAGPQVLYTPRYYEIRTAVWEGTKFSGDKMLEFQIPKESKRLLIRYRMRYPKGITSEVFSVISMDRRLANHRAER